MKNSNNDRVGKMKQEKIQGGWDGWRKMILKKKVVETSKHTSFYFIPEDEKPLMMFIDITTRGIWCKRLANLIM